MRWLLPLLLLGACASTNPEDYAASCEAELPARLAEAQAYQNRTIDREIAQERSWIEFANTYGGGATRQTIQQHERNIAAAESRRDLGDGAASVYRGFCLGERTGQAEVANRRTGAIVAGIVLGAADDALWEYNLRQRYRHYHRR